MKIMYYCKKCHNIVFSEEDYTNKLCFRCERCNFISAKMSDKQFDSYIKNGTAGSFLDELWGVTAKKLLLYVQANPEEHLYYNEKSQEFVSESGKTPANPKSDILNWKDMLNNSLKLGQCGELYTQHLLETMGYDVYRPYVDDHGIDFLAQKVGCNNLLVQVKTVKQGNYTFIKKSNFHKDKNFVVFYINVNKEGEPSVYVYPSKAWPEENETEISYADDRRFTYHPYAGKGQKSKAEYGISGAKKYYLADDKFCIDTDDLWVCNAEKFNIIKEKYGLK